MTTFDERRTLEEQLSVALERHLFKNDGNPFYICPTGIEFVLEHSEGREFLSRLRGHTDATDPTGTSFIYFPDRIVIDTVGRRAFWLELKVMKRSPRVSTKMILKRSHPRYDNIHPEKWVKLQPFLIPEYWGVIERRALDNYRRLCRSIGDRSLMLIVYADFHPHRLIAIWEQDMVKLYEQDRELFPDSNRENVQSTRGSGTPWANVSLGNFLPLESFLVKNTANKEYWKRNQPGEKMRMILGELGG
ncbi:hypothetical protein JW877_05855 [bacterium]|nr:hypothetical protein [bacterium]